jgi:N-acetylneuraminic acid mutarotase
VKYLTAILFIQILCLSFLLAQGPWTPKADMQTARPALSASVVNGKFYVMGGIVNGTPWSGPASPELEIYDPTTDNWDTTKANMPSGRNSLASVVVNGKIYALGGQSLAGTTAESSFWEYDPLTDTWDTTLAQMPEPRSGLSAAVVNNKIYVVGGWNFSSPKYRRAVLEYDPVINSWDTTKAPMPTPRAYLATCVVNNKIYAFGGINNDVTYDGLNTLEVYDPTTNTWDTTKADMPAQRIYLEADAVDSLIYILGGSDNPNNLPASNVWEYNTATDTFREVSPMPLGLMHATSGEVNRKIYNFGGFETAIVFPFIASSRTFEYNPQNDPLVAIEKWDTNLPGAFSLHQNYPNPFNPSTNIKFTLPKSEKVKIEIFNLLGEKIEALLNEQMPAGSHEVEFKAINLPSGVYLYRIKAGEYSETKKMIHMK